MFLSSGDGYLGDLPELHQGCQVPFHVSRGNVGFLLRHCSGKGSHLRLRSLLKAAAQKAHQVKTAINLKPLPNIAPQDEFAYHQFRDMKLKGRHFEVELVTI